MTRFARAKGSKSSNARVAEEATNWNEFKRQTDNPKTDSPTVNSDLVKKTIKQIKEGGPKNSGWADFGVPPAQPGKTKKRKQAASEGESGESKKAKYNLRKPEDSGEDGATPSEVNTSFKGKSPKGKFPKGNQPNAQHQKHNKPAKIKNGTDFKRKKPFVEFSTININGASIKIAKFDGFDVKHDDAVRLKEMRSKMLATGIPKAEVDAAIKKERRNAEKALSREKKKVCFNCRKSGHNLSDCPDLGAAGFKNVESTGTSTVCYKCGSTEHTHYQCQVKKNKEYSFATCFICKEQGHISSQCPDNPKGLYPQGGSCKICGEVTHLKKDCPRLAQERTENVVTLDTLSSTSNVESLEGDVQLPKPKKNAAKKKKIVKF